MGCTAPGNVRIRPVEYRLSKVVAGTAAVGPQCGLRGTATGQDGPIGGMWSKVTTSCFLSVGLDV